MSREDQVKHVEMVQGIINRMAANSFVVKGWAITLVAVLLALDLKNSSTGVIWVALVPALGFWYLDSFYLRQERLFRELHNAIVADLRDGTEKVRLFDMNTRPYRGKTPGLLKTMFWRTRGNRTVPVFYGSIVLVVLVIWRVQSVQCGKVL